jgi:hypothetical protein
VQANKLLALAEAASKMDSDEEDLFYYGTSGDEETCDPSDAEICILQDDDTASEETVSHDAHYFGFDIKDDDYESWDSDHEDHEEDGSQIHEDGSEIRPINVDSVMVAASMDDTHTSTNSFFNTESNNICLIHKIKQTKWMGIKTPLLGQTPMMMMSVSLNSNALNCEPPEKKETKPRPF